MDKKTNFVKLTPNKVGGWNGEYVKSTDKFLVVEIEGNLYHVYKNQLILNDWWYSDQPIKEGDKINATRRLWDAAPGNHVWVGTTEDYNPYSDGEDISI